MSTYQNYFEKDDVQELELEILTQKYLRGEIGLRGYQKKIQRLERRMDLRRVASRLRLSVEGPKEPSE